MRLGDQVVGLEGRSEPSHAKDASKLLPDGGSFSGFIPGLSVYTRHAQATLGSKLEGGDGLVPHGVWAHAQRSLMRGQAKADLVASSHCRLGRFTASTVLDGSSRCRHGNVRRTLIPTSAPSNNHATATEESTRRGRNVPSAVGILQAPAPPSGLPVACSQYGNKYPSLYAHFAVPCLPPRLLYRGKR